MTLTSTEAAGIVRHLPIVDEVLDGHAPAMAGDLVGYRNHVYRVANLCLALAGDRGELEKIAVSAVFHDLGIWTHQTFDYIAPSIELARAYLATHGRSAWSGEIDQIIAMHHKATRYSPEPRTLVEAFRRADWVDVTLGVRSFGVSRPFIRALFETWPSAGFHRRLVALALTRFCAHPLTPLPMVRW